MWPGDSAPHPGCVRPRLPSSDPQSLNRLPCVTPRIPPQKERGLSAEGARRTLRGSRALWFLGACCIYIHIRVVYIMLNLNSLNQPTSSLTNYTPPPRHHTHPTVLAQLVWSGTCSTRPCSHLQFTSLRLSKSRRWEVSQSRSSAAAGSGEGARTRRIDGTWERVTVCVCVCVCACVCVRERDQRVHGRARGVQYVSCGGFTPQ